MTTNLRTVLLINQIRMLKLIGGFNKFIRLQQPRTLDYKLSARYLHQCKPDNKDEEIVETVLDNSLAIGINIPHTKNILTETALQKLHDSIKSFEQNDKLSSAVLFGYGGNFCNGIVATSEAVDLSHSLLKTLDTLKKPIIGALDGNTRDFGLHLALMCDIRVIEEQALIGSNETAPNSEILPLVYERLILTVGLGRAAELIFTQNKWRARECLTAGFANKIVDTGSCLGQAMLWAKGMAFKTPLEKLIEQKTRILSTLPRKVK